MGREKQTVNELDQSKILVFWFASTLYYCRQNWVLIISTEHINLATDYDFCCEVPWRLRTPFLPVDGREHLTENVYTIVKKLLAKPTQGKVYEVTSVKKKKTAKPLPAEWRLHTLRGLALHLSRSTRVAHLTGVNDSATETGNAANANYDWHI